MVTVNGNCDICHGLGWVSLGIDDIHDPAFGKMKRCACQREKDVLLWRRDCGLTEAQFIPDMTFHSPGAGTKSMMEAARVFIANPIGSLFFYGGNGVGKTTLAYVMVSRLILAGHQTVYTTGPVMLSYIRAGYDPKVNDETATKRIDKLQAVPVLVIDELDKVRPTEWADELLSMFIDARYRRREELGTVVICNNPDNLRADIASRLSAGVVVENNDSDYRKVRR